MAAKEAFQQASSRIIRIRHVFDVVTNTCIRKAKKIKEEEKQVDLNSKQSVLSRKVQAKKTSCSEVFYCKYCSKLYPKRKQRAHRQKCFA